MDFQTVSPYKPNMDYICHGDNAFINFSISRPHSLYILVILEEYGIRTNVSFQYQGKKEKKPGFENCSEIQDESSLY